MFLLSVAIQKRSLAKAFAPIIALHCQPLHLKNAYLNHFHVLIPIMAQAREIASSYKLSAFCGASDGIDASNLQ